MRSAVDVDQAVIQLPLEGHGNGLRRLENLKRKIEIHDPRNAGDVALPQRIGLRTILKIFRFLRRGPGLIRNLIAHHDGPAGQHIEPRCVILKIGRRRA